MLKNDEHIIVNKLILTTFLALLGSLLSTLYISTTHVPGVASGESVTGAQPYNVFSVKKDALPKIKQ